MYWLVSRDMHNERSFKPFGYYKKTDENIEDTRNIADSTIDNNNNSNDSCNFGEGEV